MTTGDDELTSRAQARVGTVLRGKYRLDRVLGVGGMAVVYKATHRNQAEFAVKMLHPELCIRDDMRARFLREGYAANSVKHPGAVRVVDDDVAEDGAAFLVMELLDGAGRPLHERHGCACRWPPRSRRWISCSTCSRRRTPRASSTATSSPRTSSSRATDAQGPRLRHRAAAGRRDGRAGRDRHGDAARHAGVHGARAGAREGERDRRADGRLGRRGDALHAAHRAAGARGGERLAADGARGDGAARSLAAVCRTSPSLARVVDRRLAFEKAARWRTPSGCARRFASRGPRPAFRRDGHCSRRSSAAGPGSQRALVPQGLRIRPPERRRLRRWTPGLTLRTSPARRRRSRSSATRPP